jgi:hypothetical protein
MAVAMDYISMKTAMKKRLLLLRFIVKWSYRYARQSLRNFVKSLVFPSRKPYYDPRLEFLGQYILHWTRIRPIWAITCDMRSSWAAREGAGSQAFQIMRTISFARASGLTYLHSPFSTICHADRPMPEWAAAWEKVFNLGAGEALCDGRRHGVVNNDGNLADIDLCIGWRERTRPPGDWFKALIPEFRRKYYLNKSPHTTHRVRFAIHMRRGDVSASQNSVMYTSTEKVLAISSTVKTMLELRGVPNNIRVYGQGKIEDLAELSPLGAEYFLDADPIWTMQELIEADILIVAKSCFSYYAGLISRGIKIFEPSDYSYWWPVFSELDGWLPCQEDGSVDPVAFDHRLALLLQAKRRAGMGEAAQQ